MAQEAPSHPVILRRDERSCLTHYEGSQLNSPTPHSPPSLSTGREVVPGGVWRSLQLSSISKVTHGKWVSSRSAGVQDPMGHPRRGVAKGVAIPRWPASAVTSLREGKRSCATFLSCPSV